VVLELLEDRTLKVTVATCQFPVDADIGRNRQYVLRQMHSAKEKGAHVAHFPEAALSGYAGTDFKSYRGFDWILLETCMRQVLDLARELKLWVILGSTHRLTGQHKPHDSVYIIDDSGLIVDRYDKMFCSGDPKGRTGDLAHYSPGSHFAVFDLKGIRCGVQICYDYCFPELYREYKRRGVQLIFHSYHAGHASPERVKAMQHEVGKRFCRLNKGSSFPEIRMPSAMHTAAGNNHVWISCSNTSARQSCFPSFFIRVDGIMTGRLRRNAAGVLASTVDTRKRLSDGTAEWRARAMRGVFHSGNLVRDSRSDNRTRL
jgi:deaminated glutathione amidase